MSCNARQSIDAASFVFNPHKRLTYLNLDSFSSQFLIALLNVLGIQTNQVFTESLHTYLALPSPTIQPFTSTPHFMGCSSRSTRVDAYNNVVACCCLNDGDYWRAHNELQTMFCGSCDGRGLPYRGNRRISSTARCLPSLSPATWSFIPPRTQLFPTCSSTTDRSALRATATKVRTVRRS